MANICASIELEGEPRTLKGGQLNQAREVAADVVEKLETNEATIIFIEGLRPVGSITKMKKIAKEEEEEQDKVGGLKEEVQISPCQCTCTTTTTTNSTESQEQKLTEPLSA